MSCSGHHFSVHSPDCKAHMSIQSNRPIQVDAIASSSSVTPLDGSAQRAWSSASLEPAATQRPSSGHAGGSPAQMLQIQAYGASSSLSFVRCTSSTGTTPVQQQVYEDSENNYTLVILDCSPHPTYDLETDGAGGATQRSTTCESSTCAECTSSGRCHCQTELIVRQQIEHDHSCHHHHHHHTHQDNQQRQLLYGSGSIADRSASQTTTRSQETVTEMTQQEAARRQPLQQIQYTPPQQQYNWTTSSNSANSERVVAGGVDQVLRQSNRQNDQWQDSETTTITELTTTTHEQQQQKQAQKLSPRPGTRIVKRWNWNRAEFVEEEVAERQQLPVVEEAPRVFASKPQSQQQHLASRAWNQQEIEALSSELSPTPQVNYDPSWLAYRKPDEASVAGDPLYRDLMLELRRLEEGVVAGSPGGGSRVPSVVVAVAEPIVTPDFCAQKPAFGQPLLPERMELDEYENVEFIGRLIPNSDPTMRVEWTKNGAPLLESSRLTSEYEFGVVRLCIRRCEAQDSGVYECKAINALGEAISRAALKVNAKGNVQYETLHPAGLAQIRALENPKQVDQVEEVPLQQAPKFLTHIQDYVEKDEGESVHFECCLGPVDDPDMKTEWFFNGRPLVTGSRFHTIDDFGFIVLDIDWLFPRDTGEYICRATNKWGSDFTRTVLRVRPAKNIILESQLGGDNASATIDKLRQLEFPDLPAGEPSAPEPERAAHFVQPLRTAHSRRQFKEGDNVHFEARVAPASDGALTVEWFHNERPLISGHRFKPTFDFGHILLDILYVYPEDSGIYKCVARNSTGADLSEFEIQVEGKPGLVLQSQLPKEMEGGVQKITDMEAMWNRPPDPEEEEAPRQRQAPEFVLEPKACVAFEGSCARFCCRILAHPRPRVSWFINDQLVVTGSRYKLTHDGMYHLIIPKCLLSDAGSVRVHAKNLLGECSARTDLQVRAKVDDYRGVLKNSPNPWYDEQTLKLYRRQRNSQDDDQLNESEDFEEFLLNYQQRQQQQQQQLRIATEMQTTSPLANQVIGYMEPGTPDVNLLAGSSRGPLIEPGDLHPVVIEQQAIMAPAPSTIGRAMGAKDQVSPASVLPPGIPATPTSTTDIRKSFSDAAQASGQARSFTEAAHEVTSEDLNQQRVFGLVSTRRAQANASEAETRQQANQANQAQQIRVDRHSQQQQQQQQRVAFGAPPASPENVEHGHEIHSHFHKQLQVERRQNKEITREIIEKETFEQEHRGLQKDNLVRGESMERRSVTPAPAPAPTHTPTQQQVITSTTTTREVVQEQQMIPPEFVQKIQPCQAIDGDEARFECVYRGEPAPTISWYRENKLIKASNLYSIETNLVERKSSLVIKRVTLNGNAVYTVKAENAAGSAKSSANLVVEPHPLPQASKGAGQARQFDAMDHLTGSAQQQQQQFSDVRGFASPSPSLDSQSTSTFDFANFSEQQQQQHQLQDHNNQRIKSVRTRRMSPDELSSLIRASPDNLVAPTFLHTLNEVHVRPGELARLDARLIGSSPLEVRWLKDGQRVRPDKQHKLLLEGDLYTLLILEAAPPDAGFYECVVSNRVGEARCGASLRVSSEGRHSVGSFSSSLTGTGTGTGSASSSQMTTTMTTMTTQTQRVSGESAAAEAFPTRQHFGLTARPHHQMMSQYSASSSAQASGAQPYDGSSVLAFPVVGTSQQQQQPQALIPKLIKGLDSQLVFEGKSVTLRCQISAHPRAEVSWFKVMADSSQEERPIKPSKYFRIFKDNDETHCLKILETFQEDAGEYKCLARAQHGQLETSATIQVLPNSPR